MYSNLLSCFKELHFMGGSKYGENVKRPGIWQIYGLLGCDTIWTGTQVPTFLRGTCSFNLQCRERRLQASLKNAGTHLQHSHRIASHKIKVLKFIPASHYIYIVVTLTWASVYLCNLLIYFYK
jgi:hypothetical protein